MWRQHSDPSLPDTGPLSITMARTASWCSQGWRRLWLAVTQACVLTWFPPSHQTRLPINSSGNPAQPSLAPKQWQVRVWPGRAKRIFWWPPGRGFSEGASTAPTYRLRLPAGRWQRAGEGSQFLLHEAGHGGHSGSSSAQHSRPSAPAAPSARLLPGCLIFSPHSSLQVFAHLFPSISILSSFCRTRKTSPQGP